MNPVENLLRRAIGLDTASIGPSAIQRTLRLRMKALGLADEAAYLARITANPLEWEELLETVVVTETWFFRDQSPFQAFVQLAQAELRGSRSGPLRVLSAPCSTGEEPYSLAMALLDAGVARDRFAIEAVDISARAIERAQRALYGKNSFRPAGAGLEFRERHFTKGADGFRLKPAVRDTVTFMRGNLVGDEFYAGRAPYDFIFCRNLLIYFDRATQRRTLQRVRDLLTPQGVLFVGPAELPLTPECGFVPIGVSMAFACRKAETPAAVQRERSQEHDLAGAAASTPVVTPMVRPASVVPPAPVPCESRPLTPLQQARSLADAGQLAAAAALGEAHLQAQGPSAEVFYLLGLVRDASGDPAAMDYYRKALYLEPDHYETLLQIALLLERDGDPVGARTFKRRAERLQQTNR